MSLPESKQQKRMREALEQIASLSEADILQTISDLVQTVNRARRLAKEGLQ
jgi:hypothetical protein